MADATEHPRDSRHGPPRKYDEDAPHDNGDGGNSKPPPDMNSVPNLAMIWGDAPAITGHVEGAGAGGDKDSPPVPALPAFHVDISSIHAAMQSMLDASRAAVDGYNQLEQTVAQAIFVDHSTFGQEATYTDTNPKFEPGGAEAKQRQYGVGKHYADHSDHPEIKPDEEVRKAGVAYAQAMNPAMTQVLKECADAIELAGRFIVRLDRAGTYYAHAEENAVFPEPTGKPVVT
ncbi:hypothetical protein AB0I22_23635 [Streptomyces sp. NPDC050610]|uniref:hypothetical protein n=1 Tax=Streptomyces sp. NPDC050610 TaxID=3157097 RepID=UPI003447C315